MLLSVARTRCGWAILRCVDAFDDYRCTCDDTARTKTRSGARPYTFSGVACLPCFWLTVRLAAGLRVPLRKTAGVATLAGKGVDP